MEDPEIIALYLMRSEQAIEETDRKYGDFCRRIAMNILSIPEDAEECVFDAYHAAWNRIPPEQPACFRAFLGRIIRNVSISRFRANRAQKRYQGMEILLSELEDCVPETTGVEQTVDGRELTEYIVQWLSIQTKADRILFIRRYWYGVPVKRLAAERGESAGKSAQRLFWLRKDLKVALEEKGVIL